MLHHPLRLDFVRYAAGCATKPERTLNQLIDSNRAVLREIDHQATLRTSRAKLALLLDELHGRALAEDSLRRCEQIARFAALGTDELTSLSRKAQGVVDSIDCLPAVRRIHREKLHLIRAELRFRESGRDRLPARDECGPEDDD